MARLRNIKSIFKICFVLAKYDALSFLSDLRISPIVTKVVTFVSYLFRLISLRVFFGPSFRAMDKGQRLALALTELGPTYIKLGQALSIRPDLLGENITSGLKQLQDRVPPFPFEQVKAIIERDFNKPLEDVFPEFERESGAAASIAQVHFAKDANGNEVAVKIVRPNIGAKFRQDSELFYYLAAKISKRLPKLKRLKLKEVVDEFVKTFKAEMDMRLEAAAASELKENLAKDKGVKVPHIYWQKTSRNILTLERIYGIRVDDLEEIRLRNIDINKMMKNVGATFFNQVFRDGFFHADMHPGNMLIDKEGRLVLLDFGIMGRLEGRLRVYLAEMMIGFLKRDYMKVAQIHFMAGFIPQDKSVAEFAQACRSIGEPIFGLPQNQISVANLLEQLFTITETFEMEVQTKLLMLQKTMMLGEGLGRKLNPEVNFWSLSAPLVASWAKKNLYFDAKIMRNIEDVKLLKEELKHILEMVKKKLQD